MAQLEGAQSNQPEHANHGAEAKGAHDELLCSRRQSRTGGIFVRRSVLAWARAVGMRVSHERIGSETLEVLEVIRSKDSEHGTRGHLGL